MEDGFGECVPETAVLEMHDNVAKGFSLVLLP
jgi:hypothetical protein